MLFSIRSTSFPLQTATAMPTGMPVAKAIASPRDARATVSSARSESAAFTDCPRKMDCPRSNCSN